MLATLLLLCALLFPSSSYTHIKKTSQDTKQQTEQVEPNNQQNSPNLLLTTSYGPNYYDATNSLQLHLCSKFSPNMGIECGLYTDILQSDYMKLHLPFFLKHEARLKNHKNDVALYVQKTFGSNSDYGVKFNYVSSRYGRTIFAHSTQQPDGWWNVTKGILAPYKQDDFSIHTTIPLAIKDINFQTTLTLGTSTLRPNHQTEKITQDTGLKFKSHTTYWWQTEAAYNTIDNYEMPQQGVHAGAKLRTSMPVLTPNRNFAKLELQAGTYIPLTPQKDYVFAIHGHAGFLHGKNTPIEQLFYGKNNNAYAPGIRGFLWGNTAPVYCIDTPQTLLRYPIGGTRALSVNTEFFFPCIPKKFSQKAYQQVRAYLFYDLASSWKTSNMKLYKPQNITRNDFGLSHSTGIGIQSNYESLQAKIELALPINRRDRKFEPDAKLSLSLKW